MTTMKESRPVSLPVALVFILSLLSDISLAAGKPGARLPLSFVPNAGGSNGSFLFQAQSRAGTLFFSASEVTLVLRQPEPRRTADDLAPVTRPSALAAGRRLSLATERPREEPRPAPVCQVKIRFLGALPTPAVVGADPLPGVVSYFIGNDPARWRAGLPTYAAVVYRELYPGIDLRFDGTARQVKATYTVAPGADPSLVRWRYDGAPPPTIDPQGNILVGGSHSSDAPPITLIEHAPVAWQGEGQERAEVASRFEVAADGSIGIALPEGYDPARPLILDPTLDYSTYLGGFGEDNCDAVVVTTAGTYVAGLTASTNLPPAGTPYQGANGGDYDAYVCLLNPAGTALVYTTYLGGASTDYGLGLAVDASGNAYVAGLTLSTNFPVAGPAFQGTPSAGFNAFVSKLSANGSSLLYSTYLGGGGDDLAFDVAVDGSGNAFVTGRTSSTDFPLAGTPYQSTNGGGAFDAFVAKLNPTAATGPGSLVYSTYLGGSGDDRGAALLVDSSGNAYLTGRTTSTDFPTAGPPYRATSSGSFDAYVAKLSPNGSSLLYSTYLGGNGDDRGLAIARDPSNNGYVTGLTQSTDFPLVNQLQTTFGGVEDAFVAKVDATAVGAASLVYSTYLGGSGDDQGLAITVDGSGNASVTGFTDSPDFPTQNAFQPACGYGCGTGLGYVDAFVTTLTAAGSGLTFSTFLGGNGADYGFGITRDSLGRLWVAGESVISSDFPLVNPFQAFNAGNYDVFVARIDTGAAAADLSVLGSGSPNPVLNFGDTLTYTITASNAGPGTATGVRLVDGLPPTGVNFVSAMPTQGSCAAQYTFVGVAIGCDLGTLAPMSSASVTIAVTVTSPAPGTLTNSVSVASRVSDPNAVNNATTQSTVVAPCSPDGSAPAVTAPATEIVTQPACS